MTITISVRASGSFIDITISDERSDGTVDRVSHDRFTAEEAVALTSELGRAIGVVTASKQERLKLEVEEMEMQLKTAEWAVTDLKKRIHETGSQILGWDMR